MLLTLAGGRAPGTAAAWLRLGQARCRRRPESLHVLRSPHQARSPGGPIPMSHARFGVEPSCGDGVQEGLVVALVLVRVGGREPGDGLSHPVRNGSVCWSGMNGGNVHGFLLQSVLCWRSMTARTTASGLV